MKVQGGGHLAGAVEGRRFQPDLLQIACASKSPRLICVLSGNSREGTPMTLRSTIEYFYSAHSAFAYLGSKRLMAIAGAAGRRLVHRPMDLRRVVREAGSQPISERSKAHIAYFFGREIDRWSEERAAPVVGHMPTHHRNDITLPNCVVIAGILADLDVDHLAHVFLEAHWRDDADLADPETLAVLIDRCGHDAKALLASAGNDPAVAAAYATNTDEAIARSVFGSPTYFVDGDMFYGQDRLELIEKSLRQ